MLSILDKENMERKKEKDFLLIYRTSENGEVTVNMFAFHGCEGDLAAAMDAQVSS